jgi:cytochrome P450
VTPSATITSASSSGYVPLGRATAAFPRLQERGSARGSWRVALCAGLSDREQMATSGTSQVAIGPDSTTALSSSSAGRGGPSTQPFDGMGLASLEDPYPVYAELRREGAVRRGGPAIWYVTRYAEVARLLRDRRLGAEFPARYHEFSLGSGPAAEFRRRIVLYRDPPEHTRLRQLMSKAFTPKFVPGLSAQIEEVVDDILSVGLDRGNLDLVEDLAYQLPVAVACELIGIPPVDRHAVRLRAVDLGQAFGVVVSDEDRQRADDAVVWLRDYVAGLIEERRRAPRADLVSVLLKAEHSGDRLTPEEITDNLLFAFFAGFETTVHLIGTGAVALLQHPRELERLRENPSLVPTAVEEFLRYDAPISGVARIVLETVEVDGQRIRPGRVLLLLLGSANRDERQFDEPDRLDVGRSPNHHLSFGGGIHHCMGAALARVETATAFSRLLARTRKFELLGEPEREASSRFRGYAKVPVSLYPAAGGAQ